MTGASRGGRGRPRRPRLGRGGARRWPPRFEFDVWRRRVVDLGRDADREPRRGGGAPARGPDRAALRRRRDRAGAGAGPVEHRRRRRPSPARSPATPSAAWPSATTPTRRDHERHGRVGGGADAGRPGRGAPARHRAGPAATSPRWATSRPEELGRLLDTLFEGVPAEGRADARRRPRSNLDGGVTVVIPFQTPQSVARFGQPGIARDDPDFFAAYVVNQVFGDQGFGSRLMEEVREKRGLTYGIGTYLLNRDHADLIAGHRSPRPTTAWRRRSRSSAPSGRRMASSGVTRGRARRRQDLPHRRLSPALRRQRADRAASSSGCRWTACRPPTSTTATATSRR